MDEVVRRYVEEVDAVAARRATTLGAAELAEIAREIGLSDADLAAVEKEVEARLVRARNFAANEMWEEAMNEIEPVNALAPHRADVLDLQTRIYAARYRAEGREEDRLRSLELARAHVALAPSHEPTYALMRELQQPRSRGRYVVGGVSSAALAGAVAWAATASLPIVVAVVMLTALLAVASAKAARPRRPQLLPDAGSFAGLLPAASSPDGVVPEHGDAHATDLELPVVLDDPADWDGVSLVVRRATADTYEASTFCHVALEVRPHKDAIDALRVRIEVEWAGGTFASEHELVSGGEPPARPDRPLVRDLLLSHDAGVLPQKVRLELLRISRSVPERLADREPLEVRWEVPKPEQLPLEFWWRGHTAGEVEPWAQLWWEVHNGSDRPVKDLFCKVLLLGTETDEVLQEWSDMLTYQHRPLFAGETRLRQVLVQLPEQAWGFVVVVTRLD